MANTSASAAGELERLAALRAQGVLSDQEFATQKARVLGTPAAAPALEPRGTEVASGGVSDLWVYGLLAIPLVAAALVAGSATGNSGPTVAKLFALPNLVLMLLDHSRLKAAGKGLPAWTLILGFLVIPLYLFFRARTLGRGMAYVGTYVAEVLFLLIGLPVLILLVWR